MKWKSICSPDRTNRHNSTNGEEWGSMDDGGIFGNWIKYGGNMEGVGKCVGVWREVREGMGKSVGV